MKTFLIVPLLLISNFLFSQGEELWTTFITNSVNTLPSAAQDIIADDDGNVYVTSNYTGTIINAPSSISPPTNKYNAFIAKINSSGNVVWLKQLTGPKDDVSYAITLDHNKNVYVVGAFYDSLQLDGNFITLANHPATKQMYVLKLDTDGNFIWHYTPTYSTSTSVALDIEVDHNENCFVVGSFRKKLKIGNDTLADSPPATYENGIIFKLNPNGVVDWYQRLMGEYDDFYGYGTKITQICKAGYNEYYFGGNFVKYGQFSDTTFTIASGQIWNQDVIIGKIDNQGNFLWRHNFGVINPDSQACLAAIRKLVTNNAGELCMTGIFGGDDNNVILTIDTITMTSLWADEVFFSKFSPGGNCIWAKCVKGGLTSDIPTDLDITPEGNFLIPIEGSQTMIFIDTTTPQLFNRRVAAYVISGTDGRFISWDPLSNFPHSGLIKDLLSPQYCYDSYGNRYTFGKGTPDPPMSLDYQLYITKRSSDAVLYSGNVFHDKNLNASIDSGEIFLPHILIVGENDLFYKMTDTLGHFEIQLDSNNHTFKVIPPKYWYINYPTFPHTQNTIAPYPNDTIPNLNFGLNMIPGITDVRVVLTSTRFVPGFSTKIQLDYKNIGTVDSLNGTVKLIYHDTLNFISSSVPYFSHIGDTIIWNYSDLEIGENNQIEVLFNVPADVNLLGQTLTCYGEVTPLLSDTNKIDNNDTLNTVVTGAYDPNYKENNPKGLTQEGFISLNDSIFEYEIHFQNTGSDSAVNIVLVDTLSKKLNISSFEMLSSSHYCYYEITGPGIVTWTFPNIYLPDSTTNLLESMGFVKFKIKTVNDLPTNTIFKNTALIYFDFNPPIITNTVINKIYDCDELPLIVSSQTLCLGDSIIAYSSNSVLNSYSWTANSTSLSSLDTLVWVPESAQTYVINMSRSNSLCNTIDTSFSIIVNLPDFTVDPEINICSGDSVLIYGEYRNAPGTFLDTLQNGFGCKSIYSTTLIVNQTEFSVDPEINICSGDSVLIYGEYRNAAGTFLDTLQNGFGCKSIYSTTLIVNQTDFTVDPEINICSGDSVLIYGEYRNAPGTFLDTMQNGFGCKSIYSTTLIVNQTEFSVDPEINICSGDSVLIYGEYRNAAGTFLDTLQNGFGCKSIYSTTLIVNQTDFTVEPEINICSGDSVLIYGEYRNAAGTFLDTLQNGFGCNSIYSTTLTVSTCLGLESLKDVNYRIYPNPGNGDYTIEFENPISSTIQLNVYDMNHKLIHEATINTQLDSYKLNMSNFESGIYFLQMNMENQISIDKIVKL